MGNRFSAVAGDPDNRCKYCRIGRFWDSLPETYFILMMRLYLGYSKSTRRKLIIEGS